MQNIPETFCPAKWDELLLNFFYNTVNACCKSVPMKFDSDYESVIEQQRQNLLNGVKDPSCDYCWKTENNGGNSLRNRYLEKFDNKKIEFYKKGEVDIKYLQINLGNSCNLQCIYCNPKFSSKWEDDVRKKKYPILTDKFNYEILKKNKGTVDQNLNFLNQYKNIEVISLMGGEPLINNRLFDILPNIKSNELALSTNLMVDTEVLDKLLSFEKNFKRIYVTCSIDSTDNTAQFLRNGIDIELFYKNLDYLASKSSGVIELAIQSLMTNISIIEIKETSAKFLELINRYNLKWYLSYCQNPRIFGFEALPDHLREDLIDSISDFENNKNIRGTDVIKSALREIKYNKQIFKEFSYFIKEWEQRKLAQLPDNIKEKLYAKTK